MHRKGYIGRKWEDTCNAPELVSTWFFTSARDASARDSCNCLLTGKE